VDSDYEKFQEMLQEDMKTTYSEVAYEHATKPRNVGQMSDADTFGKIKGPCGDTMAVWLKVVDGVIKEATFVTDGCQTSHAAGSMTTEMAKGKTLDNAMQIGQEDVLRELGGLPGDSEHCALLASNTLKKAIVNYRLIQSLPKRENYKHLSIDL
jgi:nitrogen fixation NifU-like protein